MSLAPTVPFQSITQKRTEPVNRQTADKFDLGPE